MKPINIAEEFDYVKIDKKNLHEIIINNSSIGLSTITIEAIGMEFLKHNENNENINNKGEDIMKILELYEERQIKKIEKETDEMCEKAELSGEAAKIVKKLKKIAQEELDKKGLTDDLIVICYIDTEEVRQEKEKILNNARDKKIALKGTIAEVKALLEITENFEQKMEVLKSYGIVTKDGTISLI